MESDTRLWAPRSASQMANHAEKKKVGAPARLTAKSEMKRDSREEKKHKPR
jgi:hypothetical protein